ncbi:MAG: metallophosphoesterase [Abditibacteriota bacterium]|nr:metallophosphoesterase [Abditibacteriota bacterium]
MKEKTIAELNPDFENMMVQILKPRSGGIMLDYTHEPKPFSLFHFSDIHADVPAFKRLAEFYAEYEKYFDCAVCTGDLVDSSHLEGFDFWVSVPGHEKFMIAVGNHDALRDHKDWKIGDVVWEDQISMAECYDTYFAPFIDKWGVVYEPGKTYYYKDFDEKKVRFIVIDGTLRASQDPAAEEAQLLWFKSRLEGAKEKDYTAVAANHFPVTDSLGVKCNFTESPKRADGWYREFVRYQEAVDGYMKSGGKFACWIGGHDHCDYLCYNINYPEQLDICVNAASPWQCEVYSAVVRAEGLKCRDLANALVVDTSTETLKLLRIGADSDSMMVQRHGLVISYKTKEIINQY